MSKEQFAAVAPTKIAEREADRAALYERTAERLGAQLEAYPALSSDHEYLQAKRIKLEPSVYQTPRGSMAIPAYDADGKLWSIQYVAEDGEKRFALNREKRAVFTWSDQPIQWVISRRPLPSSWPRVTPPPPR